MPPKQQRDVRTSINVYSTKKKKKKTGYKTRVYCVHCTTTTTTTSWHQLLYRMEKICYIQVLLSSFRSYFFPSCGYRASRLSPLCSLKIKPRATPYKNTHTHRGNNRQSPTRNENEDEGTLYMLCWTISFFRVSRTASVNYWDVFCFDGRSVGRSGCQQLSHRKCCPIAWKEEAAFDLLRF